MSECRGKTRYKTFKEAEKGLLFIFSRDDVRVGELHVYKCPKCQGYHVGHQKYYEEKQARTRAAMMNIEGANDEA